MSGYTSNSHVFYSRENSSNEPLGAGETFTGGGVLSYKYPAVAVCTVADQDGELYVEFSNDGENWTTSLKFGHYVDRINPPHQLQVLGRYCRVRFVNGSQAQATFNIKTSFGDYQPLSTTINGLLSEGFNATVVRPTDYLSEVAAGRRQGRTTVNKWGTNDSVANSGPEIIVPWGGAFAPATDIMSTAQTFDITYDNTADGAGQTGALMLQVDYLDEEYTLQTAYHVLGNTGSDTTTFTGLGINRVVVVSSSTSGFNEAKITFTATTDGTTQAEIPAESSVTHQLLYHTPINHTWLTDWLFLNVLKLSGGSAPRVTFSLYSWSRVTSTRYHVADFKIDASVENSVEFKPTQKFPFGGREVVWLEVSTNTNGTEVSARLSGVLERVE